MPDTSLSGVIEYDPQAKCIRLVDIDISLDYDYIDVSISVILIENKPHNQ